jgi:hypothetical protein
MCNPTLASKSVHVNEDDNDNNNVPEVKIVSASDARDNNATAKEASSTISHPPPANFYKRFPETMKGFSAPLTNQKIVNESRDHKETLDAAKLQTSMACLMYSHGDIDWEEGTVKDIPLPTFTQEYKNLLKRSASVQVIQLTNLFKTIFSTKSKDKDNEGPLNQLMSLYVFPQKVVKDT